MEQDRCPRRPLLEEPERYNRLFQAFNQYKSGYLPHSGGMNDQNCQYPILMQLISATIDKAEDAQREKERALPKDPGSNRRVR